MSGDAGAQAAFREQATPTVTSTPTASIAPTAPTEAADPSFADRVSELLPAGVPAWTVDVALAVFVLVVALYVSRLARRLLGRRIARRFRRPSVTRTVLRSVQGGILALGGVVALDILGLGIGNIALSVTVFSAVVGFVLAPIVGSILNGLFILSEQPYEIGDMIHIVDRDTYGFVEDITLRYTKVFTLDNTFLVVPNGTMRDRDVVNFSAEDSRTRLRLDVLVTYESDLPVARDLTERAARRVGRVIEGGPDIRIGSARYPAAPRCYIDAFAEHGIRLRLRYWASEPYRLLTIRSRIQENLAELVAETDADVEFAYPHSHLVFDETSGEMRVSLTDGEANTDEAPPTETEMAEGEVERRVRRDTGDGA